MLTNTRTRLAVLALLGLSTLGFGFGWSSSDIGCMATSQGPSIAAPDTSTRGNDLPIQITSSQPGLSLVVTDVDGNEVYNSESDPGATESPDADGSGASLAVAVHIPADAKGPLTITAQDGAGRVATKTVTLN